MKKKRLTKEEKSKARVAIAKDVIKQVEAKRFKVLDGNAYVKVLPGITKVFSKQFEKGDEQLVTPKRCEVCARGAMFICAIDKYNHITPNELVGMSESGRLETVPATTIGEAGVNMTYLLQWFSMSQIMLIEDYFEGISETTCRSYLYNNKSPSDRLIAIMKNIIKNKGTFKP